MSSAAGTNCPSSSQKKGNFRSVAWLSNTNSANPAPTRACARVRTPLPAGPAIIARSLHERCAGVRLQLDLAERALVLADILLQHIQQGLGLLRTEIDALEIVNVDVVRRGLVHQPEQQKEVPKVDANLHAVGIAFAILGCIDQVNLGLLWRLAHRPNMVNHASSRVNRPPTLCVMAKYGNRDGLWQSVRPR